MKVINIVVEDDEHRKLLEKKGKLTWREFIVSGVVGTPTISKDDDITEEEQDFIDTYRTTQNKDYTRAMGEKQFGKEKVIKLIGN